MIFFSQMMQLQLNLFFLILIGIIMKKIGVISEAGKKCLSDFTVNLILPCNIIQSFREDIPISADFFDNCVTVFAISLGIQTFSILVGHFFFLRYEGDKKTIFTYGLIVSNSSFIGIPVIDSLYGALGVLYTSIFQIPVRVTMWSSGLALFTDVNKKDAYKKLLKHPCIVAIVIGMLFMLIPVDLPGFIDNTLTEISKCMVPISMIVIGAMLEESRVQQFFDLSVLYFSLIRLIVYPLLTLGILAALQVDVLVMDVTVLLSAMPMAGTTAILADKYNKDSRLASQVIFVSTFLSIITLPLFSLFL